MSSSIVTSIVHQCKQYIQQVVDVMDTDSDSPQQPAGPGSRVVKLDFQNLFRLNVKFGMYLNTMSGDSRTGTNEGLPTSIDNSLKLDDSATDHLYIRRLSLTTMDPANNPNVYFEQMMKAANNRSSSSSTSTEATSGASQAQNHHYKVNELVRQVDEMVRGYLDQRRSKIDDLMNVESSDKVLRTFVREWNLFKFVLSLIVACVGEKCGSTHPSITDTTNTIGLAMFHRDMVIPNRNRLFHIAINMVNQDRDSLGSGVSTSSSLDAVRDFVDCLCQVALLPPIQRQQTISFNNTNNNTTEPRHAKQPITAETTRSYNLDFVPYFVEASRLYYRDDSSVFIASHSMSEYILYVDKRFREESDRMKRVFRPETIQTLNEALSGILIAHHTQAFQDEFGRNVSAIVEMFQDSTSANDRDRETTHLDMIAAIFRSLNTFGTSGITPLVPTFEKVVVDYGLSEIVKIVPSMTTSPSDFPSTYVGALYSVHSLFNNLVTRCFKNNDQFAQAVTRAMRTVVNTNAVCKASRADKSPELLAQYCDSFLRKGGTKGVSMTDDTGGDNNGTGGGGINLDGAIQRTLTIFDYVQDKDYFEVLYKKLLARRLVRNSSVSTDAEQQVISRLKQACGPNYVHKLQRMFTDVQVSKDSLVPLFHSNVDSTAPKTTPNPKQKFEVKKWIGVAMWTFNNDVELCAVCRNLIVDPCIECQSNCSSVTGESDSDCKVAWGVCNHAYHFHCVSKWLKKHSTCPLDNTQWELLRCE